MPRAWHQAGSDSIDNEWGLAGLNFLPMVRQLTGDLRLGVSGPQASSSSPTISCLETLGLKQWRMEKEQLLSPALVQPPLAQVQELKTYSRTRQQSSIWELRLLESLANMEPDYSFKTWLDLVQPDHSTSRSYRLIKAMNSKQKACSRIWDSRRSTYAHFKPTKLLFPCLTKWGVIAASAQADVARIKSVYYMSKTLRTALAQRKPASEC